MRILALAGPLALLGLAACNTGPESYASMTQTGVGFGDYQQYLRQRETAHRASVPYSVPPEPQQRVLPPSAMPPQAPSTLDAIPVRARPAATPVPAPLAAPVQPAPVQPVVTAPIAAQTLPPAASAPMAAPMRTAAVQPAPQPAAGTATFSGTSAVPAEPAPRSSIRDQNIFHGGSSQRVTPGSVGGAPGPAPAEIVTVTSVPPPSESGGPNLIAYALNSSGAVGTETYRRMNPLRWSRWQDACLQYRNQDAAQLAFLSNGGPQRDPDNLDPDGDGYACWWDPAPIRQAAAQR